MLTFNKLKKRSLGKCFTNATLFINSSRGQYEYFNAVNGSRPDSAAVPHFSGVFVISEVAVNAGEE